ncbi:peptidoglycan-binding protein [Streptomyces sp. NPDC003697]
MQQPEGHVCPECGASRDADSTPSCPCAQRVADALREARTAEAAAAEDFDPLRIRPYVGVPATDEPDAPGTEAAGVEAPGVKAPDMEAPNRDAPDMEAPGADPSGVKAPRSPGAAGPVPGADAQAAGAGVTAEPTGVAGVGRKTNQGADAGVTVGGADAEVSVGTTDAGIVDGADAGTTDSGAGGKAAGTAAAVAHASEGATRPLPAAGATLPLGTAAPPLPGPPTAAPRAEGPTAIGPGQAGKPGHTDRPGTGTPFDRPHEPGTGAGAAGDGARRGSGRSRRTALLAVSGAVVAVAAAAGFANGLLSYESPARDGAAPEEVRHGVPDAPTPTPSSPAGAGVASSSPASANPPPSAGASPSESPVPSSSASSAAPSASPSASAGPTGPAATAGPTETMAVPPVLRRGDQGPEVTELQLRIRRLYLYTGEADGVYDGQLEDSVRTYQWTRGIRTDESGVYGPATRASLEAETSEP